ncbi:MAG: aminotransferase [Longimicrobiales bacterium]
MTDTWTRDLRHVLHPWTHFESFRGTGSLVIDRGEGCYVYDAAGNEYLDAVGGLWCNAIGMGRPEMAKAISDQVTQLAYANPFQDMTTKPAAELASVLAERAPTGLSRVFYTASGSAATETAYRLIQFYQRSRGKPEKRHIISRVGSYHGSTYMAMSIGGKKADHVPEFEYATDHIHHLSCPNPYRAPDGLTPSEFCDVLVAELEDRIVSIGAERVAAFFAEPVLGAGGVIVPPDGYHRRTRDVCRRHDVLYVSDEVVTAFGRLGHWFSSEDVFGIQPDMVLCAKGLTSGYLPLGACIYSEDIHDVIANDPDRVFAHGFTYSGHPVCCAAALENIRIIEQEGLLERVRENGPYFREALETLRQIPIVGDVRGAGFMLCVESVADAVTKEVFPEEVDIGKRIADRCQELGLLVRPILNLNVMSPPLTLSREEIDSCVSRLGEAMSAVSRELVGSGA